MKTLVLFGSIVGAVVSSALAEEASRSDGKGPRFERRSEGDDRPQGHREGKRGRPPFGGPGEMFKRMDKDNDGIITKEEFFASPRLERLPEEKRDKLFSRLDSDGDGSVSREEIREMRKDAEDRAKREFRSLDKDGNGGLSFEEFSEGKFLSKLPEEKRRQIFERMDTDGSGEITAEDKPKGPPRRPENLPR